jgi:hypothetical protein
MTVAGEKRIEAEILALRGVQEEQGRTQSRLSETMAAQSETLKALKENVVELKRIADREPVCPTECRERMLACEARIGILESEFSSLDERGSKPVDTFRSQMQSLKDDLRMACRIQTAMAWVCGVLLVVLLGAIVTHIFAPGLLIVK